MDQHCLAFLHGLFDENPKDHFEPQHHLLITAAMGGNDQMWFRRSGTGFQYASHILIEFEQAVSCKVGERVLVRCRCRESPKYAGRILLRRLEFSLNGRKKWYIVER